MSVGGRDGGGLVSEVVDQNEWLVGARPTAGTTLGLFFVRRDHTRLRVLTLFIFS